MRKLKTRRRPEIVDAALAIADERGLDALSMRAVAARLELTPMALYGYVRDKEDLLDALHGRLLAEIPEPDPGRDWRGRLREVAHGIRQVGHRHPAVFPLLLTRPAATAEGVRAVELVFRALVDAGVPEPQIPRVERLVSTFVLGFVLSEVTTRFAPGTVPPAERLRLRPAAEIPVHHRLGPLLSAPVDWDAEFDTGLTDIVGMVEAIANRDAEFDTGLPDILGMVGTIANRDAETDATTARRDANHPEPHRPAH